MLLDLSPAGDAVGSLFEDGPSDQAVDRINGRFGRGSIGLGLAARTAEWRIARSACPRGKDGRTPKAVIRRADQVCGNLVRYPSLAGPTGSIPPPLLTVQYTTAASAAFPAPTADSRVIVAAALRILERLWREGFALSQAPQRW